jgi:hypothetical protein
MEKVFISQPMKGKSDEEIRKERELACDYLNNLYKENYQIIDSYFPDFNGNAVAFLGKSIEKLSEATVAVFLSGWEHARGCRIEHDVAINYEIKTIDLG